jgi:hypothetical protein
VGTRDEPWAPTPAKGGRGFCTTGTFSSGGDNPSCKNVRTSCCMGLGVHAYLHTASERLMRAHDTRRVSTTFARAGWHYRVSET